MRKIYINANLVDVLEKKVLRNSSLLVEEGKIAAIGAEAEEGDEVTDLEGKYVIPGLFNCHVHITAEPLPDPSVVKESHTEHVLNAISNLEQYIQTGVTFIRDVGSHDNINIELRDAIRRGKLKMAPDMQACGNPLCMTGGTTWNMMGFQADGEEELRKAARLMLRRGADVVKLMATGAVFTHGTEPGAAQLEIEELQAAIKEAHKAGVLVTCHAHGLTGIKNAIYAGTDCIEHGSFMDDEAANLMAERGIYLNSTFCPGYAILTNGIGHVPDDFVRKIDMDTLYRAFQNAYHKGVVCGVGSDAGCPFNYHTYTPKEMILMVEKCGLTPMEALVCGTINSAKICGMEAELGSLSVGKKAHFAVYEENPTENIRVLDQCVMTAKNGTIIWSK